MAEHDKLILGDGEEDAVVWEVAKAAHLLVCGKEGDDKRLLRRRVICGALAYPEYWQVLACDPPEEGEFGDVAEYPNVRVATGFEESLGALREAETEVIGRQLKMREANAPRIRKLDRQARRLLVVVRDLESLTAPSRGFGERDEAAKRTDERKMEARETLHRVAVLGAAAGVHLLLSAREYSREAIPPLALEAVEGRCAVAGLSEHEAAELFALRLLAPEVDALVEAVRSRLVPEPGKRQLAYRRLERRTGADGELGLAGVRRKKPACEVAYMADPEPPATEGGEADEGSG